MVEILSQEEIEALLASLSGSEEMAQPAAGAPGAVPQMPGVGKADRRAPIAYEVYDFRRPDKFSKDQLRTMQMLHETFARLFSSTLSAYLRAPVHIDLISVEQIPYDEYIRAITSSLINIFSMQPLSGQALLEIEFDVIISMIDRLLGGPGTVVKRSQPALTDIERPLVENVVDRALSALRTAWEGIVSFTPIREGMETSAQFVQIVPPNDIVVSILFEIRVGETHGAMSLCIPYLLLKPVLSKLSAQRWFSGSKRAPSQHAVLIAQQIQQTRVPLVAVLGSTRLTLRQILDLKEGDVILLTRRTNEPIDIMVGNKVKFRARPGLRGKHVVVQIEKIVANQPVAKPNPPPSST
ncbi:MAG: flagellar motor switch protein FliM [Armatimonadota bacterium]|nr:flagellar motor switch protein FliM [Armatimonadota bacterium]